MEIKQLNEEKIKQYQNGLWEEIKGKLNDYLKSIIELTMREELTSQLKAEYYERNGERTNQRNGCYQRELTTLYGNIPNLSIPRPRCGNLETEVLNRYERRQEELDKAIGKLFLSGVSARTLGKITTELTGKNLSAGTVSNINKELDEKAENFRKEILNDEFVFIYLDGIYQKVKELGIVGDKSCLCAMGIKANGEKKLLSFQVVDSESEENWRRFVIDLKQRGLQGKNLKLVITDGNKGLIVALNDIYPFIKRQRCIVHKMRNVSRSVKKRANLKMVLSGVAQIFSTQTKTEAIEKLKIWKQQWEITEERAVRVLEDDFESCLSYFDFDPGLWSKIRTTNPLERAFREFRKRTDNVYSFTNEDSLERITYGIIDGLNQNYQEKQAAS